MFRLISPVFRSLRLLAMCILLMLSLSACSRGGAEQQAGGSGDAGDPGIIMAPGTGGVAFRLAWQQSSSGAKAAQLTPSFNSCVDYGIDTIAATVSNGTTTVTGGPWPCALHEGIVLGIPAGTNYTVLVEAMSGPTTTIWEGQVTSINVTTGQITNAGMLTMSYTGGDSGAPTVSAIGPHSNPGGTTNVPVTDRFIMTFNEPMAVSTITTNNISLNLLSSPVPGTIRYNPANNTAEFTPSANLTHNTEYVLEIISCVSSTCVRDKAGNQLATGYTHTFTTEVALGSAPTSTPSGVTATPGNAQVTLDWIASSGSTSYNVYYSTSSPVTTMTGTLISDVRPPYVHLGRTNSQIYYYIITAGNGYGESPNSSIEVNATPAFPLPGVTPLPPASLTVGAGIDHNTLDWPVVGNATSYNLYWSTSAIIPNKYSADNVVRGVTSPYDHSPTTNGVTYCYIITAVNSSGESADSMQSCVGLGSLQLYW